MAGTQPRGAHLVGSVPLPDAESVFRSTASVLGTRLRRVTDGETGGRLGWIIWQLEMLSAHPQFDVLPPDPERYAPNPSVKRKAGVSVTDLKLDDLGYAREARRSWQLFSTLQSAGELPAHWRFQVSLPTPLAPVFAFIHESERADIEPIYEAAMRREIDEIVSVVPHDRLAIQWDTAVEFGILEGLFPAYFPDSSAGIRERLARYATWVPDDVELGYHLCYGDADHEHFVQPTDAGRLAAVARDLSNDVNHPIAWIHLPVPRDRFDDDYLAPLRDVVLPDETALFLGLVHFSDGVEGTRRRIDAAQRVRSDFGVATECGLGRRPPETIEPLLQMHAEVSAPIV
jgi:hypothetical protein